jgi:RNA polymerase sigma-70 factor (ECF subfamily)
VWLLAIVRNTCYSKLKRNRVQEQQTTFDDETHGHQPDAPDPEETLLTKLDVGALRRALEAMPEEFREVIVMRELEGLSYKEIAEVTGIALGTVMSRLARGRARLQQSLKLKLAGEL